MNLEVEKGEDTAPMHCTCCGAVTRTVHGFVYAAGDARAIYYAAWSDGHLGDGVTLAIAVGDWDEDADASRRVTMGLNARSSGDEIQFSVLSPDESPWGRTDLLGAMLPRDEALSHPFLKEVYDIAGQVVTRDDRIAPLFA